VAHQLRSAARRDVDVVGEGFALRGTALLGKGVQVVIVAHALDQHILFVLEKAAHHRVARCGLQWENRFAIAGPGFGVDA
jgi:hypothetical protein